MLAPVRLIAASAPTKAPGPDTPTAVIDEHRPEEQTWAASPTRVSGGYPTAAGVRGDLGRGVGGGHRGVGPGGGGAKGTEPGRRGTKAAAARAAAGTSAILTARPAPRAARDCRDAEEGEEEGRQ